MTAPFELKLLPNLFLTAFLFFLLVSALVVIGSITLYLSLKIILTLGLILYGNDALKRYYFLSRKKSIRKIYRSAEEAWSVELGDGFLYPAILAENSIFTSYLIILNFKIPSGKRCSSILFLSKKNRENFRELIRMGRKI